MALTEEEKQKIVEEEEFRQKIRQSQNPSPPPKKKGIGCLTAIFVIFIFLVIFGIAVSSLTPSAPPTSNVQVEAKTGSYQSYNSNDYSYKILYQQTDNRYVATFQPFLPRDDRNLIEAALQVFKTTYGNNAQINPKPLLETRESGNVIKFKADKGNYYVLPIKEDTGEIHTFVYWKE